MVDSVVLTGVLLIAKLTLPLGPPLNPSRAFAANVSYFVGEINTCTCHNLYEPLHWAPLALALVKNKLVDSVKSLVSSDSLITPVLLS